MSAGAWLLMWRLGDSPWGHWLHSHVGVGAVPGPGAVMALGGIFVGGWVVMTIAMMLPTTLPLVQMFQRLTAARPDRVVLTGALVAGYLAAWTVFGVVVFAARRGRTGRWRQPGLPHPAGASRPLRAGRCVSVLVD